MSAAERRRLGEVAGDLQAGETREAILSRRLAGGVRPALPLASLDTVPGWLRSDGSARRVLGHRAALAGLGPALATSIDGRWLSGLATAASDETLDWATTAAGAEAVLPTFDGAALDGVAAAILRSAAPAGLADFAASDHGQLPIDPAVAERLLEAAA